MEIRKILWPTDLSKRSAQALPFVQAMSEKFGAEIHLLYVVSDVRRFDHFYGDADPELLKGLQAAEFRSAESMMGHVCQRELSGCPAFRRHVQRGDPAQEILRLADQEKVDLIIMATHGAGMTEDHYKFFGSVAEKVVKAAKVPVLTIPAA